MQNNIFKLSIIYFLAIILVIINLNNVSQLGSSAFLPLFEIMIIYYFAIHKNNFFGIWFLFLIGVWSDALLNLPIGLSALIYILTVKLFNFIRHKKVLKEDFPSILKEFCLFISFILAFKWLLLSIYYKNLYNFTPFLIQIAISSIAYILVHQFFEFISRKILKDY